MQTDYFQRKTVCASNCSRRATEPWLPPAFLITIWNSLEDWIGNMLLKLNREFECTQKQYWGWGGIWNEKAHKWHPACAWLRGPNLRVVCNNLKLEWENERFIIISGDFMWSWGLIQRQKPQRKSARRDKSPSMVFIREFKSIPQNNSHINITFTSN